LFVINYLIRNLNKRSKFISMEEKFNGQLWYFVAPQDAAKNGISIRRKRLVDIVPTGPIFPRYELGLDQTVYAFLNKNYRRLETTGPSK
jgi:hypothetical protein